MGARNAACRCRSTPRCGRFGAVSSEMAELVERLGASSGRCSSWSRWVAARRWAASRQAVRGAVRDPLRGAEKGALRRQGDRGAALPALRGAARGGKHGQAAPGRPARWRCPTCCAARKGRGTPSVLRPAASTPATASPSCPTPATSIRAASCRFRAGNVREQAWPQIYRDSPLFRALRDPDALLGRCGRCEYRAFCGGSRSRAYALTGEFLATDPWCNYQPARSAA